MLSLLLVPNIQLGGLQPRHIGHMTMEAFFQNYILWCDGAGLPSEERAGCRTFREMYEVWKDVVPMRTLSQHARSLGLYLGKI